MAMMSGRKVNKSDLGSPSSSNSSDSWMERFFGRRGRRSTGSAGSSLPASPVATAKEDALASPVASTKEDALGVRVPSDRKPASSVDRKPAPSAGKPFPLVGKKKAPPGSLAGKKDDRGPPPVPFPLVGKKKDSNCKNCMRMWKDKGVFCNRQGHKQGLALWVANHEDDQDENVHPDKMESS